MKVAIDGTVASGKDSVSKKVAERCNLVFIETGALYRSVAWYALSKGYHKPFLELEDEIASLSITLRRVEDELHVFIEGNDATPYLRSSEIDFASSVVASTKFLRIPLIEKQRQMASMYERVLMSGRAIGTSVLPDADVKVYLDADLDTRAQRRYQDRKERFPELTLDMVRDEIRERDGINQERSFDPDTVPEGAVRIDTTNMSIDEVVEAISEFIHQAE
jgi:CMP/dCMP kinase